MLSASTHSAAIYRDQPNGARIAVVRDASLPLAAINVRIACGSINDPPGRSGLAHVLEHLMFGGTANRARGEHVRIVQSWGGYVNATTSTDWTKYYHVVSPDLVDAVLEWEVERFTDLSVAMTTETLRAERQIVHRERLHRMTNLAYGSALEHIAAMLNPVGSPYRWLPIGCEPDIDLIDIQECRRHHREYYTGPRVNVAIVGDVDVDRVVVAATRLTDVFPKSPPPAPLTYPAEPRPRRMRAETRLRPKIYLGYALPPATQWHFDLAHLAAYGLGHGPGARLPDRLMYRRQLASSVTIKALSRHYGPSLGIVEIVPCDGVPFDDVLAVTDDAMSEEMSLEEFEYARAIYLTAWLTNFDSLRERCDGMTLALQMFGSAEPYFEHCTRINDTDSVEVAHVATRYWHPERRLVELVYENG